MAYAATVIVPLLRQADHWLEQCVRSALAQTVPTEVVVVHSKVTPASNMAVLAGIAAGAASLVVVCEDPPGSFPRAINTGIRHARADRVGFLLSDDWLDPGTVAECLKEPADIVSTGLVIHFHGGAVNTAAVRTPSPAKYQSLTTLHDKALYLSHFFLIAKTRIQQAGGVDETIGDYPGIDDFDLIWTLLEQGASVALVEKRLYHYRDHDGERLTLQDPERMKANFRRILEKHRMNGAETEKLLRAHARWFGRPIYAVLEERAAARRSATAE